MPSIAAFVLAAWMTSSAPSAIPVDWASIGLRVAGREVVTQEGPRRLPFVVAVQEQSPAYFAGVLPGDVISFIRCGSWTWNYIDRSRTGTTFYRSHTSVGAADIPGIAENALSYCNPGLGGLLSISREPGDTRQINEFIEFRTAAGGAGRWFNTKAEVVATIGAARATQADALTQLRARAATDLRRSPCSYDVSNAYDLKAMPPLVQQMAAASRAVGREEDTMFWRDVVWAFCSEEQNGPLPSFETAVFLMSKGSLKPCEFDPKKNYAAIELDYERRQRTFSWNEYNSLKSLEYMFGRLLDDAQRACFYNVVRAALGKG